MCAKIVLGLNHIIKRFVLFVFVLIVVNVPVNNFSVMLRRSHLFLSITSTFGGVNVSCTRKQHTDPAEDRTRVSRSGVRRSNH